MDEEKEAKEAQELQKKKKAQNKLIIAGVIIGVLVILWDTIKVAILVTIPVVLGLLGFAKRKKIKAKLNDIWKGEL